METLLWIQIVFKRQSVWKRHGLTCIYLPILYFRKLECPGKRPYGPSRAFVGDLFGGRKPAET